MIASPKHILWTRTDSIGDNVLAGAMLGPIRRKWPRARITVVCQEAIAELYEHCPHADAVITVPKWLQWLSQRDRERFLADVARRKPDVLFNTVYSAGPFSDIEGLDFIPTRVAFRTDPSHTATHLVPDPGTDFTAELDHHAAFLRFVGVKATNLKPQCWTSPADERYAARLFAEHGWAKATTIAFFAGTQFPEKHYHRFAEVLETFCRGREVTFIALGARNDFEINQRCLDQVSGRTFNLSGKLSLCRSAEVLRRCRMAVGADTGLAHIATAVGTPSVILMGGGHFGRYLPYSRLSTIVCQPTACYFCRWRCAYEESHCIRNIEPGAVVRAMDATFSGGSARPRVFVQYSSKSAGRPAILRGLMKSHSAEWDITAFRTTTRLPPVRMKAPGAATAQTDVEVGVSNLFGAMKKHGWRRLALYGAGKHTHVLLRALERRGLADKVVLIIDDKPSATDLLGIRIAPSCRFPQSQVDVVVTSSDTFEAAMLDKARAWRRLRRPVFGLYSGRIVMPRTERTAGR